MSAAAAPALQFANYQEAQPRFHPSPPRQPDDLSIQPSLKKPPRTVNQWETLATEVPTGHTTKLLDESYVIRDRPAVAQFIEEHRLRGLLLQAVQPLNVRFGQHSIKTLSIVTDDEGFETLFCVVLTVGDLQHLRLALRVFDREWWLSRAKQARGRLNFDFQLI